MRQVSITINDRSYLLACESGQEDRLADLATYVKAKVEQLTAEVGRNGDERLMLMAALLIADELWDARAALTNAAEPEPVRRLRKVAKAATGKTESAEPDPAAGAEPGKGVADSAA